MKLACLLILLSLVLPLLFTTLAVDPDPLQDICVADYTSKVKVNGYACKPSSAINETDFASTILATPGKINATTGSTATLADVQQIPGLNTLGIAMARADFAPGGIIQPHTHPRATEMVYILKGTLDVGFITTANKLVMKTVSKGEVFVFPQGLVHFQINNGAKPATMIVGFNSQFPGVLVIANSLFGALPTVPDNVLTKAFQIGTKEVEKLKENFTPKNVTKTI